MTNKFKIGDEVEVSFIGKITEIGKGGFPSEIRYKIEGEPATAMFVRESQIYPLPTPADFERKEV